MTPTKRAPARRNKHHAVPVRDPEDGYFHSTGEYHRWQKLKELARAGAIRNLRRKVAYPFVVNGVKIGTYTPDSVYEERREDGSWVEVVEDFKGGSTRTEAYRLRKRLMLALYDIEIVETSA